MTAAPTRHKSGLGLLLVVVGLITAAACSSTNTTTQANGPATTAAPATTAKRTGTTNTPKTEKTESTEATNDDEGDDTTTSRRRSSSTTTSSGGSGSGSAPTITVAPTAGNEEFCNTMATAYNEIAGKLTISSGSGSGGTGGDSFEQFGLVVLELGKQFYGQVAAAAPSDISADVNKINDFFQSASTFDDLRKLSSDPALQAAGKNFDSWLQTNCGISPQLLSTNQ